MIKETVIVMTILGCGDAVQSCDYISTSQKQWSSETACEAAIPNSLQKLRYEAYPVLTASCQIQDNKAALLKIKPTIADQKQADEIKTENTTNTFNLLQAKASDIDLNLGNKVKAYFLDMNDRSRVFIVKLTGFLSNNQ